LPFVVGLAILPVAAGAAVAATTTHVAYRPASITCAAPTTAGASGIGASGTSRPGGEQFVHHGGATAAAVWSVAPDTLRVPPAGLVAATAGRHGSRSATVERAPPALTA
jgi:hypothetical protein